MGRAADDWEILEPEAARPPTSAARRLRRIERLSWLLDRSIMVGRWRIGLDPILGLLPGIGDLIGTLLSLYVLYEAALLGIRGPILLRMLGNILLEALVGMIPVLGDIFDFAWQANARNIALVHRHYGPNLPPRSLGWIGGVLSIAAVAVLIMIGLLGYLLVTTLVGLWQQLRGV